MRGLNPSQMFKSNPETSNRTGLTWKLDSYEVKHLKSLCYFEKNSHDHPSIHIYIFPEHPIFSSTSSS